jgi:hypothetical protein
MAALRHFGIDCQLAGRITRSWAREPVQFNNENATTLAGDKVADKWLIWALPARSECQAQLALFGNQIECMSTPIVTG